MSFVRVQLIARHDTLYELPFCEIDRCLHFTDTSTRVGGEAGGVVVGDNVLDDDDLHGGPVARLFAQLRRELGEDVDPSIHGGILRQLQTRHSKNC